MKIQGGTGFLSVLKNRDFLKLWIGQSLSYASDRITQIALLGWLIASGHNTGDETSRITFFNMLAGFLLGHLAGAAADRMSRKKLMIAADVIRAALVFLLAFTLNPQASLPFLYLQTFLAGLCTSFFYSAKLAIIPTLVRTGQLQAANALLTITGMAAILFGTFIAGILIERSGNFSSLFVNGAAYLFSALVLLSITERKDLPSRAAAADKGRKLSEDFRDILLYLRIHRRAWNLILMSVFLSFLSSFFYIGLTVTAVDYFKLGTEGIGKLLTMHSGGMIAGAFAVVWLRKELRTADLMSGAFLVIFLTTGTASLVRNYSMAWIWLTLLGAANSAVMITVDTLLQKITPDRFRGKVFGFRSVLTSGVFLLSLLAVSSLLHLTTPFQVFKLLALVSLAIAVLILLLERHFAYDVLRMLARGVLKLLFSFGIEGEEHFRYRSKMILAGNHTGFLDSPVLIASSRRPLRFMVSQSVFQWPVIGWIVKSSGVIPVAKGKGALALGSAAETLRRGGTLAIFPEGALSKDGLIGKFHRGVARLHLETGSPVVPFAIHGGFEAWRSGQALPKLRKVTLQFGQPIEDFKGTEEEFLIELRSRVQFIKESLERRERARKEQIYLDSVLSLTLQKSDQFGPRTALSLKGETGWSELSYIELSRRARDFSDYLIENGIKRGERIAILSESRPEWGVAFFAALRAGVVLVPVDVKLTSPELVSILSDCEPSILLVSPDFARTAKALAALIPSIREVILLAPAEPAAEFASYETLRAGAMQMGRDRDAEETALIIYTSGTTGNPKGVMISFSNLVFQVRRFESLMNLGPSDTFLSILPLNHLLELTGGFLGVLHAGGRICYSHSLRPQEIASLMKERRVTFMITVPLFLKVLQGSIEKEIRRTSSAQQRIFRLSFRAAPFLPRFFRKLLFYPLHAGFGGRLKGFVSGGAPLDAGVAEFFDSIGIPVYQGYGLTETSPVVTVNWPGNNRVGSVGKPLQGVYLRIQKTDESGETGEIWTKGPHVMKGYFRQPGLTAEAIDEQRWYHTGDLGRIDKDGYLYITGRIKNLIVLPGGKKVHPEEVEAVLSRSPLFKEVCVIGCRVKSGPRESSEEVTAVLVPSDRLAAEGPDDAVLQAAGKEMDRLGKQLAAYKRPSRLFIHREELPKTATRKIKRPLLLKWLESQHPAAAPL